MAKIVAIHGMNNQRRGPDTLKSTWLPALRDGIRAGCGKGAWLPEERDFEITFWGDLFRPKGQWLSADVPPLEPRDLTESDERALLELIVAEAERTGAIQRPPEQALAAAPAWLHAACYKLAASEFFRSQYYSDDNGVERNNNVVERLVIHFMKQTVRYMNTPALYQEVQARVDETVRDDTEVLIGHSLGSVVAYEALCRNPRNVQRLITIGSPLGVPTIIYDRLRPPEGWPTSNGKRVRMRPAVKHWVNVWDQGDLVALVKPLAPLFEGPVDDLRVSTGKETPHAMEKYLTDAEVGRAIGGCFSALGATVSAP